MSTLLLLAMLASGTRVTWAQYVNVTTLAGSGLGSFADGAGKSASFNGPWGVAVDASGNVFVGDLGNCRLRKVTPRGIVTTLAGSGSNTFLDGIGTGAAINNPYGVAVDASGIVLVGDRTNNRIRKVTPGGVVTTFAGSGNRGWSDGAGVGASFYYPNGVAIDASGNVFVADQANQRIRKVTPGGVVSTLAGSGLGAFIDGTGTGASFSGPTGVAVDAKGNVFVTDSNRIRQVTPGGVVTTLAGSAEYAFADGIGTGASFNNPVGVAVDAGGNVIVGDTLNNRIRQVTPGGVVTTLAGSGTLASADGSGASASFSRPQGVAIDASGNMVVAAADNRIRLLVLVPTCQPGFFCFSNTLIPCPAGTSSTSTSATSNATCTACAAGTFSGSGATTCSPCALGTWSSGGVATCTNCAPGRFSACATGSSCCNSCEPGTFSAIVGASSSATCITCGAGKYGAVTATACINCAAGTYSTATGAINSSTCLQCAAGTFSGGGAAVCSACASGAWSSGGAAACTVCAAGTFSTCATASSCCPSCAAGKFSSGIGAPSCANCAAGAYSPPTGATACTNTPCPAGFYCPAGSGLPAPCPLNTFSTANSASSISVCTACPSGFLTLSTGSAACVSTGGGGLSCSSGTYFNATSPSLCSPCPAGTASSGANATSLGSCATCPAGTYSGSGAASCQQCATGAYCVGGQPFLCAAGTYGASTGAASPSSCTPCPIGRASPLPGATSISSCVACAAGSYAALQGSSECALCPPGTGSVLVGATSPDVCAPCAVGSFNPLEGQAWCAYDCPAGYRGTVGGGASQEAGCAPCGVGYYSPFSGSLRCSACPAGTYADTANASFCTDCPEGFYGAAPAAVSATQCLPCAAGTFNSVPGQPISACLACPAGKAGASPGATSDGACATCAAGAFSSSGAVACTPAPAGKYAAGAGAASATDCPLGRFYGGTGGASDAVCAACADGTTTASAGAISASQCLKGAFVCPPGTQPASATFSPAVKQDCVPLACATPLRPAAWAAIADAAAALAASTDCAGCGPGTAGTPGACAPCVAGEFCPGLLSRPLLNFSAAAAAPGGRALLAARPLPWGACPKLSTPLPASGSAAAGGASAPSRALQAAAAGGAFLMLLLLLGLATVRAPPPSQPRTWVARAAWLARGLDMYSLSHFTDTEKSPVYRPTAAGGVFTLLGLTGIATYAAYMVLQWQDSNTLVQRSLDAVDGGAWGAARALPWAAVPLPGLPAAASGLVLRVTIDGEPGACAKPLAPPTASGLLRGAWAEVSAVADCGGSGASQLTYACADCDLGPAAALSFSFHYSCQSLLLEAAAVPAYPAGATSLLVAEAAATVTAPGGGGLLTALIWEAPPLLTQCRDRVSAGGAASKRGYAFTLSSVAPLRPPLPTDGLGHLLVRPKSAALNLTIALPLSPTFVTTALTPLVPWTQLLANIVGLSGVLSVVGVLFGVAEKTLGGRARPVAGGCGAGGAGDASPPTSGRRSAAEEIAAMQQQLAALAERVRSEHSQASALAPLELAAINPLFAAAAATREPSAPDAALAAAPRQWQRREDSGDVWFVALDTGEAAWEVPEGGVAVA